MFRFLICCLGALALSHGDGSVQPLHAEDHPAIARCEYEPGPLKKVTGKVVDKEGRAVPGARVYFFGDQWSSSHHPVDPKLELGRTTSDSAGRFTLSVQPLRLASHKLCVVAEGKGTHFHIVDVDEVEAAEITLTLREERIFQGQITGPDGKPAANVTVEVWNVVMDNMFYSFNKKPGGEGTRPITFQTDAQGRFTVRGLSKSVSEIWFRCDDERYALMECNRFAGETARFDDGVVTIDPKTDSTIQLRLAAPRLVTGTVTCKATSKPLAGAWVGAVMAKLKAPGDSHTMAIWAKTDGAGRFRVRTGPWGPNLCLYAFAPEGTPYPDWSVGAITWPEGKSELEVPIAMPMGTLIQGRVIEKETGKGVANASLIYQVRRSTPRTMDVTSASRIYWSNEYHRRYTKEDGSFTQPVAAGELGYIMVKAPDGSFIGEYLTNGDIQRDKPGGLWYLVEGLAKVEPQATAREMKLDIPMTLGKTVSGMVQGPKGEKITRGMVIRDVPRHTQDNQISGPVIWGESIRDGKFRLEGCDSRKNSTLYFLDAERQWGTMLSLDLRDKSPANPNVILQPCGAARFKFLDSEKKPMTVNPITSNARVEMVLAFREAPEDNYYGFPIDHIQANAANLDQKRYYALKPDADGTVTFPSLIPGAAYKLIIHDEQPRQGVRMREIPVMVEPGKTKDFGEVILKSKK